MTDGVEFIHVEDEPPPPRRPRGPQRLRIELAVGAALLLGLFLAARLMSHHSGASSSPSRASASSSAPTPGPLSPVPLSTTATLDTTTGAVVGDPATCSGCSYVLNVPDAVRAAAVARFPAAHVVNAQSTRLPSGRLWFRQLNATVGDRELVLRVQQPIFGTASVSGITEGIGYVEAPVGAYVVTAQIDHATRADVDRLLGLVHDPRVLAP